ncbi:hypothetical protein D3C73_1229150 [compost metagenome]
MLFSNSGDSLCFVRPYRQRLIDKNRLAVRGDRPELLQVYAAVHRFQHDGVASLRNSLHRIRDPNTQFIS